MNSTITTMYLSLLCTFIGGYKLITTCQEIDLPYRSLNNQTSTLNSSYQGGSANLNHDHQGGSVSCYTKR